jgi:hypothetical protein
MPPQFDSEPNWGPLQLLMSSGNCGDFLHMGRSGSIEMYKHRRTRRYLNIDRDTAQCFAYRDGFYEPSDEATAVSEVLK